ncbi:Aste57867_12729 [Aphanomyces stellatus]|uniref:Aste57867_12729 protein n=1 Tax=Aphanomyces stellatus TaxID=120398 RepID=A0A485KWS0_9STRA|nr:hypothetical protein As57867_012681 [Aphanomyces stellatus]VFT89579.1 Aste57867_12729 [Aphanomyces stellatus]
MLSRATLLAALLGVLLDLVHGGPVHVCRVSSIKPIVNPTIVNGTTLAPSAQTTTVAPDANQTSNNATVVPNTTVPLLTTVTPKTTSTPVVTNATDGVTTTVPTTKTPLVNRTTTTAPQTTTAPTTTALRSGVRNLADTSAVTTTSIPSTTTTAAPMTTKTPTTTSSTMTPTTTSATSTVSPTTTPQVTDTASTTAAPSNSSNTTAAPTPGIASGDVACDEAFYSQWTTRNITCNGMPLDVSMAAAAASCVPVTDAASACRSVCAFPSCDGATWSYGANATGFLSSVYTNMPSLLPYALPGAVTSIGGACRLVQQANGLVVEECVCGQNLNGFNWTNSSSWGNASTPSSPSSSDVIIATPTPRPTPEFQLPMPAVVSLTQSTATATLAVTTIAVVSSTVMGTTTAATTAVASGSAVMVTLDIVQFGSLLNQLPLSQKTQILESMATSMKYAVFNFIEVGPGAPTVSTRRLADAVATCADGICSYSAKLGISKFNLFVTTLVGIFLVGAALLVLYGLVAGAATLLAPTRGYAGAWFHHLVGALVMLGLASQYAIGVTATYEIYLSTTTHSFGYAFVLAILSLLGLALGILAFGFYIIRKHEDEIKDVDQILHKEKAVNQRYGSLYDEYTFENRFFFAPKMLLALLCGMTTGAAFLDNSTQVILVLVFHVLFLVHLERCQPFQTRFMQHSMSLIMVMKILTLVLSLFLIASVAGLSSGFHDAVSHVIVGIQLLVLVGLMVRQVVLLYQRYRAMQDMKKQKTDSALRPLSTEQVEHMKLGRL